MSAGRKNNNKNKDWNTPPKYAELIKNFFNNNINLDPCFNIYSLIPAEVKFTLPCKNGLTEEWNHKNIFVNPPYGRNSESKTSIYSWLEKGLISNQKYKSEILYLIPVACNTKHFKNIIFKYFTGICFLFDTRLKFWYEGKEMTKGAPMACCIVYIGKDYKKFKEVFQNSGACFEIL